MQIRFTAPATTWIEALPIGNGHLGAMVFGTLPTEHIQVNEHTLWEGTVADRVSPTGLSTLPRIRALLFARKYADAQALIERHMHHNNCFLKPYQPLCSLLVSSLLVDSMRGAVFSGYQRELDMMTGVHRVRYTLAQQQIVHECFASLADGIIVARFVIGNGGTYSLRLDRDQDVSCGNVSEGRLSLQGRLGADGVRFAAQAIVIPDSGTMRPRGNALELSGVSAFTILLAGATSYLAPDDLSADPQARADAMLAPAAGYTYEQLRQRHIDAHAKQMKRVQFNLNGDPAFSARSTAERLAAFAGSSARASTDESFKPLTDTPPDWDFFALIFQACRYMLVTSSQPGSMPSTLQGRWCGIMQPPWNSDYHPNINMQMNYWLANPTNLDECNQALFNWLKQIARFGKDTARRLYDCEGWVMHHVSDIFGTTAPMDECCGVWPVGGAWMCLHLWEHYQFTQDSEFLRKTALPIMLESARFILDFMVEAPAGTTFAGKLVTNPSHSPENTFFTEDHRRVWFCVSAAMDTQIIDQLFRNCLAALDAGGQTSELRQKIADALKRLPPMQISPKTGRLMEWIQDFEEPEPGHRHVSHMFAIYPGDGITPTARPDLVAAARKSIEFRFANDYHATGWSLPWLGCIFARMGDGDRALQMLTQRIAHFTMPNAMFSNAHGNPQVADACGFAAAIAEMLLQSHEGFINVLPALPRQWPSGKISGLRARGGFELDIEWSAGRATRTTVRSLAGNPCRLRVNGKLHELSLARGEQRTFE